MTDRLGLGIARLQVNVVYRSTHMIVVVGLDWFSGNNRRTQGTASNRQAHGQ